MLGEEDVIPMTTISSSPLAMVSFEFIMDAIRFLSLLLEY